MRERQIIFFKHYFLDFYKTIPEVVQFKIEWTLQLISELDRIPKQYFKHVESTKGLYEIRVEVEGNIYRIFSFFDAGNIIVIGNAYQKKNNKLSRKEINKALSIMKEYQHEK
ncbi:MAG: type II toxin-antitoxin system RelE/ParE family toxin [Crocinitomicaceae bacterium]|jgi:phage-related protein|nr:type II toxin-antitoxin system RelE/ParE family toxin [Crocinitomicaceae bacterium]MDP5042893.1 type II toxin-antitoxin system RelE/ParE family toxin [Crocinitomicaceae bacterium]